MSLSEVLKLKKTIYMLFILYFLNFMIISAEAGSNIFRANLSRLNLMNSSSAKIIPLGGDLAEESTEGNTNTSSEMQDNYDSGNDSSAYMENEEASDESSYVDTEGELDNSTVSDENNYIYNDTSDDSIVGSTEENEDFSAYKQDMSKDYIAAPTAKTPEKRQWNNLFSTEGL